MQAPPEAQPVTAAIPTPRAALHLPGGIWFLLAYCVLALLLGLVVIVSRGPTGWLIALAAPVILAAMAYPRRIYLAMMVVATAVATITIYERFANAVSSLLTLALLLVTVGGMAEIAHRLTRQRLAMEKELRGSEARYRRLVERNLAGVFRSTLDGRLTLGNAALASLLGESSADAVLTHSGQEYTLPPESWPAFLDAVRQHGPVVSYELQLRARDGAPTWVLATGSLVEERNGQPHVEGTLIDITARKQAEEAQREGEHRFREMLAGAQIAAVALDLAGHITFCNDYFHRLTGWSTADLLGGDWFQTCVPDDQRTAYRSFDAGSRQATLGTAPLRYEADILTRTGERRTIAWSDAATRDSAGHVSGTTILGEDVTERRRAEQQLQVQAAALESAANAVVIADRLGRITWVNPAYTRLTGDSAEEALGQTLYAAEPGAPGFEPAVWELIRAGKVWQGELTGRRQDGSDYAEEQTVTPVRDDQGQITHFVGIKQDIRERKQHEERLSYLATHDALTGLSNRHVLEQAMEATVARARRGTESALLFIDLDNFKLVNDTLGHAAGDQLLVALSQLIGRQLRDGDLLTRVGGDEFAILLEATSLEPARRVAERLRLTVHDHRFALYGRTFMLGLSIGLVPIDGQQSTQILLARADTALYAAKDEGRNRVIVYRPEEARLNRLSEASQWGSRIKEALWDDRFVLHYQPIVRTDTGALSHYEALLRMQGEDGELILPGVFIPAAERFGLMPAIDYWLVRKAVHALRDHPGVDLFINLSGRSRGDDELMTFIEAQLRDNEIDPFRLGFEITETAAVEDLVEAERWIRRLKALGCRFALDDFGVGFTSFAYLRSLPVDQVKIDGTFIRSLGQDSSSRDIVTAMHTLSTALGKETVAEFVESAAILDMVREIGITYAQGYYLGRPGPDLPAPVAAPAVLPA